MEGLDIKAIYGGLDAKHAHARKTLGKALTLAEKIIWSHLHDANQSKMTRGESFANLRPDRVAMQDATAQMAILQFMQAQKAKVAVPTTVHCDHLIIAQEGASRDLEIANHENKEVFDFLDALLGFSFVKLVAAKLSTGQPEAVKIPLSALLYAVETKLEPDAEAETNATLARPRRGRRCCRSRHVAIISGQEVVSRRAEG